MVESDGIGRVLVGELLLGEESLGVLWHLKLVLVVVVTKHGILVADQRFESLLYDTLGDGVDQRVEVEGWEIGVIGLDVDVFGFVINSDVHTARQ